MDQKTKEYRDAAKELPPDQRDSMNAILDTVEEIKEETGIGWGGARLGSGARTKTAENKSSNRVMINLTPSELERLKAVANEDEFNTKGKLQPGVVAKRLALLGLELTEKKKEDV